MPFNSFHLSSSIFYSLKRLEFLEKLRIEKLRKTQQNLGKLGTEKIEWEHWHEVDQIHKYK